jgi:hypothetical protein
MVRGWIKATTVMSLALCFSVSGAKAFSTTYDLPGPGAAFFDGNDVHL